MIFVTVGTQLPFPRLLKSVDSWSANNPDKKVFAQISDAGPDNFCPLNFDYVPFLDPKDFNRYFLEASVIVAHAGMGSILSALSLGKPIIIMPRRVEYKEHRNDHQVATAKKFHSRQNIKVVNTDEEMSEALTDFSQQESGKSYDCSTSDADEALLQHLRSFILGS